MRLAGAAFPFVASFESIPFGGLVFFIGMSLFTRNPNLSRFVRFNIQQVRYVRMSLVQASAGILAVRPGVNVS
eukprot:6176444-Pleurochrysis_carterae.AAC.3